MNKFFKKVALWSCTPSIITGLAISLIFPKVSFMDWELYATVLLSFLANSVAKYQGSEKN